MGELVTTDIGVGLPAEGRAELRAEMKSMRQQWREALLPANRLSPDSKLGRRSGAMMGELDAFDDRVKEAGGPRAFMALFCAAVADGKDPDEFCVDYALNGGLLGAFVAEEPERMAWFENAQAWASERDVAKTVPLADGATMEDYKVTALQINTRFKRAGMYKPAKFGATGGGVAVSTTVNVAPAEDVTTVARKVAFLLRKGLEAAPDDVLEAVVVEHPDDAPGGLTPI